ncbi:MAG: hypothetical protein LBG28_15230 [Tannerella sp.]|jgi:hypothetical protein|nr:hypothetical protein [Tannerella sp.]
MESLLEQSDAVRLKGRRWRKIRNIIFLVVFSGFIIWGAIRYYYPYAEGIKSGKLNYVVYKGLIFKTYEGKLIQSDKSSASGSVPSDEFVFSVAEKDIAEELMRAGGKTVELHYTEYLGAIPWRGYSRYVVDEIISITEEQTPPEMIDTVVNIASGMKSRYNCKF